jgi:peptidoglycan-associated lipoprotein
MAYRAITRELPGTLVQSRLVRARFALALVVVAVACGGGAPPQQRRRVPTSPGAIRIEVAEGEMREVLLQLQRVHFARDSVELTQEGRAALRRVAELLRSHTDVSLFIEGHADPRGTPEYNLGLGQQRAAAVSRYVEGLGVDTGRLQLTSYGEERPAAAESDQAGLARNRRVEFRVLRGNVRLVLEEGELLDDRGNPIR